MHVAVGSHPRVAEKVPGSADVGATLKKGERRARAALLEVDGTADAGDSGSDDQDVSVFDSVWHGCRP